MPRKPSSSSKPSAANRFTKSRAENDNGKRLTLADIITADDLLSLTEDAIATGVSITIAVTRDGKTIIVTFFHDGERYPWYIQSREDWTDMVLETSV